MIISYPHKFLFNFSHYGGSVKVLNYDFNIHFFSDKDLCWKPFHRCISDSNILFYILPIQVFDPFKKGIFLLLICDNS